MQKDRFVARGMQAASAAHEMGSPLSTIAVIGEDVGHAIRSNASLAAYMDEVAMRVQAKIDAAMAGKELPLAEWLTQSIDGWRLRHPATMLHLTCPPVGARIASPQAVERILLTLLDNAAQAVSVTATAVHVILLIEHRNAVIRIIDQGPGILLDLLKRPGYEQVQSSSSGRGIGLMLAFATARRIDARIELSSRPEGTTAALTAPLA